MPRIPTGSKILDKLLNGGYELDVITTLYGPAGAGKTGLCILGSINTARLGKKVIYVDTENNFSVERFKQICDAISINHLKTINNMIFFKPASFEEQKKTFEKLKDIVNNKVGLIVIDGIAMLYRLEMGKENDIYETNRALGRQLGYLTEISRKKKIPILITNQVYADFEDKDKINMVGGDLLKYGSKCLIEIQITPSGNRLAIIKKHRSIKEEKSITFKIVEGGIIGTKEGKGFKLF
ncbi:DNA repair and recombination protein RadB [Candidatus Woesearchaeota archaeon]|nr:DNA repair and recombination protein RadB [Candidatus Woesearchaeota archaeon]|tara:strand:+ start:225 stop:938 length:714 start_codon:yes stop_codon:yes gene_type:complete